MEEFTIKSLKNDGEERDDVAGNLFPEEKSEDDSSIQNPEEHSEEEVLKLTLDKLKKQNFTLQASIKACQTTLQNKLEEFKETEGNLAEIYNEISTEREKFCSKADEFTQNHGILSDWWKSQIKFVSDLEKLQRQNSQDQENREEIEKLEKEMAKLQEINELKGTKQIAEVEVHATADGDTITTNRSEEETTADDLNTKKGRYSDGEEKIEICDEISEVTDNVFYSVVNLETVRAANRKKNRKNHFFRKVKSFLTM